jgi:hypothetical protein
VNPLLVESASYSQKEQVSEEESNVCAIKMTYYWRIKAENQLCLCRLSIIRTAKWGRISGMLCINIIFVAAAKHLTRTAAV